MRPLPVLFLGHSEKLVSQTQIEGEIRANAKVILGIKSQRIEMESSRRQGSRRYSLKGAGRIGYEREETRKRGRTGRIRAVSGQLLVVIDQGAELEGVASPRVKDIIAIRKNILLA
jgi:hypothetical protein